MDASIKPPQLPTITTTTTNDEKLTQIIKKRLLKKGLIDPSPKIIHTLRKKHLQKTLRKSKKNAQITPLTQSQNDTIAHELYYKNVASEYREFSKKVGFDEGYNRLFGKPWEKLEKVVFDEGVSVYLSREGNDDGKLKRECLSDLGSVFEERKIESLKMFLNDDDVEVEVDDGGALVGENGNWSPFRRRVSEIDAVKILVHRLTAREITRKDWKFTRMMKQSALQFTEDQMLKIVGGIGNQGCWKQAMEVVEWVYSKNEHKHYKSRFVYTKLLAVLQKGRRPCEALRIFNHMRGDGYIYPDMAAYHTIAVTLGQAGMVRELMNIIECMKERPPRSTRNTPRKNWNPTLEPDVVILNAVLNACVTTHHWKGVAWVFQELRKSGLHPNSATYGLAMEVMLQSSKYDAVHQLFEKMKRSGKSTNALTYKVLVRAFWKEGKVDEAINIVKKMEQSGIIGSASVYYELACCLCNNGRWQEAMVEVEKLKKLRHSKPLAVTFTGMILSSLNGGHIDDCMLIFEEMRNYCYPNIGTVNAMLKVYGRNDMFVEAKELFEKAERSVTGDPILGDGNTSSVPDMRTYVSMLEISSHAQQWEYFEYVYKEMCLNGYRLDQGKYARLFVEASKAGKWHLLEHIFDTTLEAGDIPDSVLFTEMLCQAMLQCDYEKAVVIVNTMALAPFQLNKKNWDDLFEKNKDRVTSDHLRKLFDTLSTSDISQEFTALELLKMLQPVCASGIVPSDSLDSDSDEEDGGSSCDDLGGVADLACNERSFTVFDERHSPDDSDSEEAEDRQDPNLPSAEEILEFWKETREKDKISTNAVQL